MARTWPIATRLADGRVLLNTDHYGKTTSKHTAWVRQALASAGEPVVTVPELLASGFWAMASHYNQGKEAA